MNLSKLVRAVVEQAPALPDSFVEFLCETNMVSSYGLCSLALTRADLDMDIPTAVRLATHVYRCSRDYAGEAVAALAARRIEQGEPVQEVMGAPLTGVDVTVDPGEFVRVCRDRPARSMVTDAIVTGELGLAWVEAACAAGWEPRRMLRRVSQCWDAGDSPGEDFADRALAMWAAQAVGWLASHGGEAVLREVGWSDVSDDAFVLEILALHEVPHGWALAAVHRCVSSWLDGRLSVSPELRSLVETTVAAWPQELLDRVVKFTALHRSSATSLVFIEREVRHEAEHREKVQLVDRCGVLGAPLATLTSVAYQTDATVVGEVIRQVPDDPQAWFALQGLWPEDPAGSQQTVSDLIQAVTTILTTPSGG